MEAKEEGDQRMQPDYGKMLTSRRILHFSLAEIRLVGEGPNPDGQMEKKLDACFTPCVFQSTLHFTREITGFKNF